MMEDAGMDLMDPLITPLADRLRAGGWHLSTAESCTGGLIAAACTDLAGSSDWFDRGFVTYSNVAKSEMLGVDAALIARDGAVSESVARAMAIGAQREAGVEAALAVTGVAGPGGGSEAKPVGTVWFAWALPGRVWAECRHFEGDRASVRRQTRDHALAVLAAALADAPMGAPMDLRPPA
jgi:nicotinamide-nucleotide amidase